MTLTPNFLTVGSIVDYNAGNELYPMWEVSIIDWKQIKFCGEDNEDFNKWFRPIPLTPEILTEWCGFKYIKEVGGYCNDRHLIYEIVNGYRFIPHCTDDDDLGIDINYLHELQLIYIAYKTVLPITIK